MTSKGFRGAWVHHRCITVVLALHRLRLRFVVMDGIDMEKLVTMVTIGDHLHIPHLQVHHMLKQQVIVVVPQCSTDGWWTVTMMLHIVLVTTMTQFELDLVLKYWEENNIEDFQCITLLSTISVHRVQDRPQDRVSSRLNHSRTICINIYSHMYICMIRSIGSK